MDRDNTQLVLESPLAVFDFDGTLARFDLDWLALKADLSAIAVANGFPDRFLTTFHPDLAQLRDLGGEALFQKLCSCIGDWEGGGFRPDSVDPELVDLMVRRARDDLPNAIFSANSRAGITTALQHASFRGVQPLVIGREDVVRGKPDPEGLLTISKHFDVGCDHMVFVGDAPDDFAAADAANVAMIQVPKIPLT